MAIAFVSGAGNQANTNSLTAAINCTGATILIAGVWCVGNTLTGITYAGNAMTQIGSPIQGPTGQYLYLYYIVSPTTGSNNMVASFSGSQNCALRGISFSGTAITGIPDSSNSGSGASGSASLSTTTIADNCIGVLFARFDNGGPIASTNMTSSIAMGATAGSFAIIGYSALKTPAGTLTMVATSSDTSGAYGARIISLAPPSTFTASPLMHMMEISGGLM